MSAVVAALGDSAELRACLAEVGAQSAVLSGEVVLVLNVPREHVSGEALEHLAMFCDVIDFEPRPGKSNALNRGISIARAEVVAFTDDDTRPQEGWLDALTGPLLGKPPVGGLVGCGGRVVPEFPPETPAWYRRLACSKPTTLLGPRHDLGQDPCTYTLEQRLGQSPIGANCAYLREVLLKEGFRSDLGPNFATGLRGGEDTELGRRLLLSGASLLYVPEAVVVHPVHPARVSLSFARKRFLAHGAERVRLRRAHGLPLPSLRALRARQLGLRWLSALRGLVGAPGHERIVVEQAKLAGMIAEYEGRAPEVLRAIEDRAAPRAD